MKDSIEFAIGFITGRPNVCKIINAYYNNILKQIKKCESNVHLTLFILYDLKYELTVRTEFYNIIPEVYKNITIRYITPEIIEEEKKKIMSRYNLSKDDVDLFLGYGYGKGRNTIMYYALKRNIDYLLFWDDDEYPVACLREGQELKWIEQNNILKHIENISKSDITLGYRCGYISPIPYIDFKEEISEEEFKDYIEAISNDIVSWESVKNKMNKTDGITYAELELAGGSTVPLEMINNKWLSGSALCINLRNKSKIPAFYNPPLARGEDTFFSTLLSETKVLKIPVYHFHDCFLKYTSIMKGIYPKKLRNIKSNEESIEQRFFKASLGWIKYKPLLTYITDRENYKCKMEEMHKKLELSIPKINKIFNSDNFNVLLTELEKYDEAVKKHYEEYIKTNKIWDILKCNI